MIKGDRIKITTRALMPYKRFAGMEGEIADINHECYYIRLDSEPEFLRPFFGSEIELVGGNDEPISDS